MNADLVSMVAQPSNQKESSGSIPTDRLLKGEWEVRQCSLHDVQGLVRKYHYAGGGSNTATYSLGLYRKTTFLEASEIHGASWWIPTTKTAGAFSNKSNPQGVLALSRLVCVPDAPKNACSFLIRHSMRFIDRKRWPTLVTYADTWRNHDGTIYRALFSAGWVDAGLTKPERTYVKDGRMMGRKRGPKTLTHAEMLSLGFECVGSFPKKRFIHNET